MAPKITLITGCSAGIGLHVAVRLAKDPKQSYLVYATMRNLAKKVDLEKEAGSALNKTLFIRELDVTKEESIVATVKFILDKHQCIDILINNAGFGWYGPLEDMSQDKMQTLMNTNVVGLIRMTQEVIPAMKCQRSGRIVNISSLVGIMGFPLCAVYSASKFAVDGFCESMWPELNAFGVWISSVNPGPVETAFHTTAAVDMPTPETMSKSKAGPETHKIIGECAQWMRSTNGPPMQDVNAVSDTLLECLQAEKPVLRYGTSDYVRQRVKERYADGAGMVGVKMWQAWLGKE
ncbi:retinol dehydrogenase 8-like [Diadema antillarum]|uniref:retinol dehydrogenase 8-like n=1 Tax=Diadema antillarum TaxID=105358 RepID=UPI003A87CE6C